MRNRALEGARRQSLPYAVAAGVILWVVGASAAWQLFTWIAGWFS